MTSFPLALLLATSAAASAPAPLRFADFFEPGARALVPSARLLAAKGTRVRMTGFMAQMETAPAGAFYLCPRPVFADEAGGGTADLPPESVRVTVRSMAGKPVKFIPGPLEVTGILEVGRRVEDDGQVSSIRLVLDGPRELRARRAARNPSAVPKTRDQEVR